MIMPYVDRDPLRGAYGTKRNAEVSGVSFDKMRLQEKSNNVQTALALTGAGLQIGQAVYGMFEAKKMEEAKKLIYDEDVALRQQVRQGIYDGSIAVEAVEGPDGMTTSIKMPEDLNRRLEEFNKGLDEKFKGFGTVRNWAKDSARKNADGAQTWAYDMAFKKATEDRDKAFSTNVDQAYKDAVATKNPDLYMNQINSAGWLSPDKKAALQTALDGKFKYDSYEQDLYTTVEEGGINEAIKRANEYNGSDEDKRTLKKKALEKPQEIITMTSQDLVKTYTDQKAEGRAPIDIVNDLKKTDIPEEYKKAALEEVKKQQTVDATSYGYDKYNEVRDSYADLKKAYKDIKNGAGSLEFDGIPITHKAILDMFEKDIEAYEKATAKGSGTSEAGFNDNMYAIVQAYNSDREYNGRKISQTDAVNFIRGQAAAGGDAAVAYRLENDVLTKGKTLYKPALESFDMARTAILDKDDYEGMSLANELKSSLGDLIADGASYEEVAKRKDMAIAILSGKAADSFLAIVDKGGMVEGVADTVNKQHMDIMKEIEAGELDDLVTFDRNTGAYVFAGGSAKTMSQLIKVQQDELLSLGYDTMQSFAPQGQEDVGALPIYTDKKTGKKIKFAVEGKEVIPMVFNRTRDRKSGEWVPLVYKNPKESKPAPKIYVPMRDRPPKEKDYNRSKTWETY